MKDKSRFVSSIIVSLMAGFIYYQFGQGIEVKLQSSIKAVLSSNDVEQYLSPDCKPFNTISGKSDAKLNKKKSKYFIKKRNTIEFKTKNETIPGDDLFSSYLSRKQAKVQKSTADKNIDFTAELKLLIKDDDSKTQLRQSKGFKIDKGNNKDNGVADSREYSTGHERIQKSFESSEKGVYGHGFEYNYIIVENKNKIEKKKTDRKKSNSSESFIPFQNYETYKRNECYRQRVVNKVRVIVPDDPQSFDDDGEEMEAERDMKSDRPEVIIPFENGDDEEM